MKFAAHQIWKIRDGEYRGAEVHIHKVLSHDGIDESFHISVPSEKVSHMPFSEKALAQSNLEFVRSEPVLGDDWEEGFNIWHEAFQKNDAGIFSVSITDAINFIFDTRDSGTQREPID